ncbi:HD domain-containing protein [Pseudooceanicola sp. CBS1P-1]|uniref:HD domain-containing protein n=1 Tax=Pseudooceanicola albus TaxID=2692189 RepID=A0A6L7G7K4_9RHOB|nr:MULTISPECIES: HD domain-containing protein [Pseudooceanicola]MBT9385829.1 HD domain-containing protein [Pseudooceanicola endophyticus]MXN20061.1 HD domain-containing protein [Pseudooceanicola albus]
MDDSARTARDFAIELHDGQIDKFGKDYSAHVIHVGQMLADYGWEYEAVGYLHDVVEDCGVSLQEIEDRFGETVRNGVDAVSRRRGEDYEQDYLPRVLQNELALLAKYADCRDNFGKIHLLHDPEQAARDKKKFGTMLRKLEGLRPELTRWGPPPRLVYADGLWVEDA